AHCPDRSGVRPGRRQLFFPHLQKGGRRYPKTVPRFVVKPRCKKHKGPEHGRSKSGCAPVLFCYHSATAMLSLLTSFCRKMSFFLCTGNGEAMGNGISHRTKTGMRIVTDRAPARMIL